MRCRFSKKEKGITRGEGEGGGGVKGKGEEYRYE